MQRVRIERELPRHEADLDERPHAVLQQPVIDLVHISEVIDRIPVLVLVVYANFVVQDGVKPHISNIRDLLHRAQVVAKLSRNERIARPEPNIFSQK